MFDMSLPEDIPTHTPDKNAVRSKSDSAFDLGEFVFSPFKSNGRGNPSGGNPKHHLSMESLIGVLSLGNHKQGDHSRNKNSTATSNHANQRLLEQRQSMALKRIHKRLQALTNEEIALKKGIKRQIQLAKSRLGNKNKRGAILSMRKVVKQEEEQAKLKSAISYLRKLEIKAAHEEKGNDTDSASIALYENFESEVSRILEFKNHSALDTYLQFKTQIDASLSGANAVMPDEKLLGVLESHMESGEDNKKKQLDFSRHSSSHSLYSEHDIFGDYDNYDGDVDYESDCSDDASFA